MLLLKYTYIERAAFIMKNLRELRKNKKLSQQKLGELLHVSQQSIHKYENGITSPDIETLKLMAEKFNTSVDYLLDLTEISRKIEPVTETMLNQEERELIETYRKLNTSQKELICRLSNEFILKK